MQKHSVILVDDHAIVREGLRAILGQDARLNLLGEAADGEAGHALAVTVRPDLILMDLSMPRLNGADATRRILEGSPSSRVLVLTAHQEMAYVRQLLAAGARGYVLKRTVLRQLLRAIEVVLAGGIYLDAELGAPCAAEEWNPDSVATSAELSLREVEVASLIASGHTNAEITTILQIGIKTVETHRARLMAKLGFRTRAQLVRFALYRGWLGR